MPRKPKDSDKLPPSVKTIEGRQKIVDFMRADVGHLTKQGYQISYFATWALSDTRSYTLWNSKVDGMRHKRFFNMGDERAVCKQIQDGQWPDDDTALLAWWEAEGKKRYQGEKPKRIEEVCEECDPPSPLSIEQTELTREEKIEHLCSSPLT